MIRPLSARLSALIIANFAAAACVGFLAMVMVAGGVLFTPPGAANGIGAMIWAAVFLGLIAAIGGTIMAFPAFLAGLIAVGIPTWWLLHRSGWTRRVTFVAVAAIECVLGGILVAPLLLPPESFAIVLLLTLPGGLAGWVIWRLGYDRRPTPPRLSPARSS